MLGDTHFMPRYWRVFAGLLVALVSACAVKQSAPTIQTETCYKPLAEYCTGDRCPTYAQSLAQAERDFATGAYVCHSEGTCAELKFVERRSFGGEIQFFNGEDVIVAARFESDSLSGPCVGRTYYGPQPTCAPQIAKDMCRWRQR